jgi:hypothetical protein
MMLQGEVKLVLPATVALLRALRLALIASVVSSCGKVLSGGATAAGKTGNDGGTDTTCSFTPCGGNIVGTWNIRRSCPASVRIQSCAAASLDPKNVTVSGSFSFHSDGGLAFDIRSTGSWEGTVPASCVTNGDCAPIVQALSQANAPLASCTKDANGGCKCSSPATPVQTGNTPYRIIGNTAASMSFCVKNGILKLQNPAGTVFVSSQ